jgi:Flp pilus assembly protein TadB
MDLFDFFKENESKLHERPAEQVWKKLERQLKKTKKTPATRRGIPFLQTGIAALILIVLLIAAVLVWYFYK